MVRALPRLAAALLFLFSTEAAAQEAGKRYPANDPAEVRPSAYLDVLALVRGADAETQQSFVEALGGAQAHAATRAAVQAAPSDPLARSTAESLGGIFATALQFHWTEALVARGLAAQDAAIRATTTLSLPDGSSVEVPLVRASTIHLATIDLIDRQRRARKDWPEMAGAWTVAVAGACPFEAGPVRIEQRDHILVASRGELVLLAGAAGPGQIWLLPNEPLYATLSEPEAGTVRVDVPDRPMTLLTGAVEGGRIELAPAAGGDCRVTLSRAG